MVSSDDGESVEFPRFEAGPLPSSESSHRRTTSNGLLSRLPFLRNPPADARNGSSDHASSSPTSPQRRAPPPASKKPRSRKGSLRKTALLGTGRVRMGSRSSSGSSGGLETIVSPRLEHASEAFSPTDAQLSPESDDYPTPRASFDHEGVSSDHIPPVGPGQVGHHGSKSGGQQQDNTSSEENLVLKPRSRAVSSRRDVSTTDEEEALDSLRARGASAVVSTLKQLPEDPAAYFAAASKPGGVLRHRASSKKMAGAKSPLGGTLPLEAGAAATGDVEWDYAATEWWGWVILALTWAVFVVGMGSCFGVWSWAWDVGETPYAPPELEDDPTLPIVGYYPALIILTGVMAWVWVIIAWVGMKYFKHAKIAGEDV